MAERGVIRNRVYAQQIKDFSGLRFGKITPTDIDGFMDFGGKLFVFVEGKHAGSALSRGQELALERLVDACHFPPKRIAVCMVVDHFDSAAADVDYASCEVRKARWNGAWIPPNHKGVTLREAIDRVLAYSNNMQRQKLRVIQGGAA